MFLFGSYMNAGYADVMQTHYNPEKASFSDIRGVAFEDSVDLSQIAPGSPEVIFLLTSIDSNYEAAGVLTINPDSTEAADQTDLSRKHILELVKLDYVDFYEDAFLFNEHFSELMGKVKNTYPDARIVPLMFQQRQEKTDPYQLSRRLTTLIKNDRKSSWVLADFQKIKSEHLAVNDLRNVMFERIVTNREIGNLKDLALYDHSSLRTLMYVMHFLKAYDVDVNQNHAIYKKGDLTAKNQSITLLGVGDMMLDRYVETLMNQNGMDYPFEKISHELNGVDYVFANFEGPIKENEVATQKSISFRFKPDVIWPTKEAGINLVSIANNHALDQGWGGRDDTEKFLKEAGIHYFGHPKNETEGNAYIGQIADKTIAFVGYDDTIFKIDGDLAKQMIEELDMIADYVIVSVHWGREYIHQPTERKQWLAHLFVDSGADVVIGHHPHVVQTMEIYNGKPVFYSLGNFIFDQYFSQDTQEGLGIGLIINEDETVVHLLPYAIPNSQPELMSGEAKTQFLEKFISWGEYDEETKNSIRNAKFVLK